MATRHKQQLADYLSRHKNGPIRTSTESSKNSASQPAADKQGNKKTAAAKLSSPVTTPARVRSQMTQGGTRYKTSKSSTHDGNLPDELLLNIFTYLDVVSLLQASQVCRRWRDVSQDNSLWQRMAHKYANRGKTTKDASTVTKAAENSPSFSTQWRDVCIARCAAWRNARALKLVKGSRLNPFTGLPKETERVLKETGITFQLSLVDSYGKEWCTESSKVTRHKSSAAVVWHSLSFLPLPQVRRLRILAVCPLFYNDAGVVVKGSPYQRSLLWETNIRLSEWTTEKHLFTADDQVRLYHLPGDLLLATWKADGEIAFFAAGIHYNQLVQRCVLGNATRCYETPAHKVIPDDIDSTYGLHDYKATVELRSLHQSLWSQQFSALHCPKPSAPCRELVFTLVRHGSIVDHTPLEKQLCLTWRTELFKGSVENMAWLDVTVLDERGEVFLTVSSPVKAHKPFVQGSDFEYEDSDHLCVVYEGDRASVHLQIGKTSPGKAFMRHLELRIKTSAVNEWFGTKYPTPPDAKSSASSAPGSRAP
ncbi:F-box only protein 15-like [Babylonia areolata]|uniref:F-box only protein 15-like n=1 Tax=Babylonia areolata TaxID=304850 RepID=UPI003FCF9538